MYSKLKDNKSPGNIGLPSEFYKIFKEEISEFLFNIYKEALSMGRLPPSMSQDLGKTQCVSKIGGQLLK